ncbi:MAG: hypothetical protein ACK5RG_04940 [Cyclobacteriaceae bacterium]|jgi:hypothetical protein|nr:hypothetical protein [Flammeovirgaceae bacterium]
MKNTSNNSFVGTDWLILEIVIEAIGDMIAYNSMQLDLAIKSNDSTIIESIENELKRLIQERQKCYDINSNNEIIVKVFEEYIPKLRRINAC